MGMTLPCDQNFCRDLDSKITLAVESFKSHLANCGREVWNQSQRDCESTYNQNHLNQGNNFSTDYVTTASSCVPTC